MVLKVIKIQNGTIRNIVVPAEHEYSGWVKFEKCLKSFFLKKIGKSNGDVTNASKSARDQKQASGKPIVMEESKLVGQTESEQSSTVKLPSLAVVILKQTSHISWGLVKEQMRKKLGRLAEVVPFADDRAVLWCANEDELKSVLEKGELFRGQVFIAKIKKRNMYMHWQFTQIEARYSWIGVEGL